MQKSCRKSLQKILLDFLSVCPSNLMPWNFKSTLIWLKHSLKSDDIFAIDHRCTSICSFFFIFTYDKRLFTQQRPKLLLISRALTHLTGCIICIQKVMKRKKSSLQKRLKKMLTIDSDKYMFIKPCKCDIPPLICSLCFLCSQCTPLEFHVKEKTTERESAEEKNK